MPWQRMGNVNGWGGPTPTSFLLQQRDLQLKILKRMRSFGMKPVLPAFAGHVPDQLKQLYPSSKISQLNKWDGFNGTYFLDPADPLFSKIGSEFIKIQTQVYGTDHLYNADPFNELIPPSNTPTYLANASATIYNSMAQAGTLLQCFAPIATLTNPLPFSDPNAIWVLQGWFLHHSKDFWQAPQAKGSVTM